MALTPLQLTSKTTIIKIACPAKRTSRSWLTRVYIVVADCLILDFESIDYTSLYSNTLIAAILLSVEQNRGDVAQRLEQSAQLTIWLSLD